MKNKKVLFCYFDVEKNNYMEISGKINPYDYADFKNEVYHMKLDSIHSTNSFFKEAFSTADLLRLFCSSSEVVDLTFLSRILNDVSLDDDRVKAILNSFFSKIEIDGIFSYTKEQLGTIIRESNNPIFLQPFTYNQVNRQVASLDYNTKALLASDYDFVKAYRLQQEGFKNEEYNRVSTLVKTVS